MFDCLFCDRKLGSAQAMGQHCLDKHNRHFCGTCQKTFKNEHALQQHSSSKHGGGSQQHTQRSTRHIEEHHVHGEPYEGIQGYWTTHQAFRGTKSFGCFTCPSCNNEWFSAHAHKTYKQGCQSCEELSHPCCLWVNTGSDRNRVADDDNDKAPHDRGRCEACRRGRCLDGRKHSTKC